MDSRGGGKITTRVEETAGYKAGEQGGDGWKWKMEKLKDVKTASNRKEWEGKQ